MPKQQYDAPSKKVQLIALLTVMLITSTIFGCRDKPSAPSGAAPAAQTPTRSKQQAMNALMALPELQAWSRQIETSSGGTVHGAVVEYDPKPRLIDGKRYFQLSFVANAGDAAQRWESFLVAESGDAILVEDGATDKTLTLAQWRATKRPLERTRAH